MSDQVQSRDADIDMGRLFGAVWRDKFRIIIIALILTAVVFGLLSMVSPKYKADTRVLLDLNESVYTRPSTDNQPAEQPLIDVESIASQIEIIRSSDLLLKVAKELKLGEMAEFSSEQNVSAFKEGLIAFGLVDDPRELTAGENELPGEQRILKAMRERLEVYSAEPARVVVIEFESTDPKLAKAVPNAIAKAYVSLESQSQRDTSGQAADFLASEIAQLQRSLFEAETRVEDFRASNDLFQSENDGTLASQQLGELASELSRVRAERSSVEARVLSVERALESGAALDTLPDVISSALIERLSEQQVRLNAQIADLSTTLLPAHPRIKALRSQINDLNQQVREQAERVLQGLRNEASINREREQDLISALNEQKAATSQVSGQEVELRALEREAASQRALLESYSLRFREAKSRGEREDVPAKARIISPALTPIEAAFPKMVPLLGATFVGSLIIMVLVTLMSELFSGRALVPVAAARAKPDEDNVVAMPVAMPVVMPVANNAPKSAAAVYQKREEHVPEPEYIANDNFSVASLANQLIEKGAGRAIIVSPEGDAGSMCSVSLVRHLADEGLRVVLVDLTGTAASSQHMLADFTLPGITELLASQAPYSDVIHCDAATRAHIIPTGNADAVLAMRAIDRLPMIMDALSSAYDLVVVDCGPTDASGLKRLTTPESEIIISMVEPDSNQVVAAAEDLVAGGYEDVLIVTSGNVDAPLPPTSNRYHA
ncbi:GumC family protein [Ahrensia sp. 13_GOM-1096m]|uniref:GumC family protein n=1 Tax=Ahrensia sp. 13_GOM-1096m TaxID=1380380 RepID=UPI00047AD454|nr:Wzz/FepE/Etk N-terminal domain-containing protein [Ahrensia sp. 13_GOM-1096m]